MVLATAARGEEVDMAKRKKGRAVVVEGVVNGFVAATNGTAEPMFTNQGISETVGPSTTIVGSPSFGKVISLRVWIDANPRDDISPKLETTELSGRNVWTPNAGCT